jgi:hypothetical protein
VKQITTTGPGTQPNGLRPPRIRRPHRRNPRELPRAARAHGRGQQPPDRLRRPGQQPRADRVDVQQRQRPRGPPALLDLRHGCHLVDSILSELEDYANGLTSGTQNVSPGTVTLGDVLQITTPTLTFQDISFTGSGQDRTFSGTITISAASASIDITGVLTLTTGAISGSYVLANQKPALGTFTLMIVGPVNASDSTKTDPMSLTVGGVITVSADSLSLKSHDDGTTTELQFGAKNVGVVVGDSSGPHLSIANGVFGILSRRTNGEGNSAQIAVVAGGDVTLAALTPPRSSAPTGGSPTTSSAISRLRRSTSTRAAGPSSSTRPRTAPLSPVRRR